MPIAQLLRNRRLLAGGALLALLIAVALWPRAAPADLASVERGRLLVTLDEEGETRVRERFVVSAPLAGRVLRIALEAGDRVVRGETVLALFEPGDPSLLDARSRAEAEAQVRAARAVLGRSRADLKRTEADHGFARSRLERYRSLAEDRIVSRDALEQAEAEAIALDEALRAAEFAVSSAEHQLELARARFVQASGGERAGEPFAIKAPIDGVVLKRLRWSEAVVPQGEPLLELGDPDDLEIVSDMLSTDAVQITAGDTALIEQWGGEKPLRARVRRVEPSGFTKISALGVEEQRVNVILDFEDAREAWEALGDAYRVEVRVVVWQGEDVLKVPTSALFRSPSGWAVFAVEAGRARARDVQIGRRNGLEAELVSGLEAGNRVVVHPSDAIADGSRISPRS